MNPKKNAPCRWRQAALGLALVTVASPLWAHISTTHGTLVNSLQLLFALPAALFAWWLARTALRLRRKVHTAHPGRDTKTARRLTNVRRWGRSHVSR